MERFFLNLKQDSRLEELIVPLLTRGLSLRIRVTGPSMSPFIRSGEVVTLRRAPPTRLSIGDVILFINHAGSLVLHRIVRIRRNARGQGINSATIGMALIDRMDGTVNIDATAGAHETDRLAYRIGGMGSINTTGTTGTTGKSDDPVRPGKSDSIKKSDGLPADWTVQTKGDAAGVDPPISVNNVLAKVISVEKSTPFMGFQYLHLESPLWKLYGIALVLAVSVKSSAIGSFLRPFYRGAKTLGNYVFNLSRSGY